MNFSALSANDRMAAVAAVIVVITGVISLAWRWGILMAIPLIAGLVVLFVVFQSRLAPNVKLPMTRGLLLAGAGGIAVLIWVLVTFQWFGYITGNLLSIDVLQFFVGLVASVVMLVAGWRAYQSESAAPAGSPPAAPPAPPAA
jgi:hypothetical protein